MKTSVEDSSANPIETTEPPSKRATADESPEVVERETIHDPRDWEPQYRAYLRKRVANNEFWIDKATRHGGGLEATASTSWVRAASLRRLKRLLSPADLALEVGCGNGSSLLGPLSHCCQAFGADLTWEMLRVAKREHRKIKGLVRADACRLPFADAKFDLVYTSRCLINVLESEMQRVAIAELFRVTKRDGVVVLIENFEEPVTAMNEAIKKWNSGEPINDEHNLLLSLQQTLDLGQRAGWSPVSMWNNSLGSFLAQIVVGRFGPRRGMGLVSRLVYPLYVLLSRMEDCFGRRLPPLGKDTMIVFKHRQEPVKMPT